MSAVSRSIREEENRYFSDGMTEEVSARLARIPDLKVISRTSAMRFRNTELDRGNLADRIAASLGLALAGTDPRAAAVPVPPTANLEASHPGSATCRTFTPRMTG